jgi:hypothetical protein
MGLKKPGPRGRAPVLTVALALADRLLGGLHPAFADEDDQDVQRAGSSCRSPSSLTGRCSPGGIIMSTAPPPSAERFLPVSCTWRATNS